MLFFDFFEKQNLDSILIFRKLDKNNCPNLTFSKILFQKKNEKTVSLVYALKCIFFKKK